MLLMPSSHTLPSAAETIKRRAAAGFTLVEVLATIAILALLGTVVATAMITGSRVMAASMNGANASVLAQSIDTALYDVLRYANVQAPSGETIVNDPMFNSDSYTDYYGAAVRAGQVVVDQNGHLALSTGGATQPIPKAAGVYTEFVVKEFQLSYDCESNVFSGFYTIALPDDSYARECPIVCRSLVEETYE